MSVYQFDESNEKNLLQPVTTQFIQEELGLKSKDFWLIGFFLFNSEHQWVLRALKEKQITLLYVHIVCVCTSP